jgi:hypothetical protein
MSAVSLGPRGTWLCSYVPAIGSRLRADLDWERGAALGPRYGDDVFLSLRQGSLVRAQCRLIVPAREVRAGPPATGSSHILTTHPL